MKMVQRFIEAKREVDSLYKLVDPNNDLDPIERVIYDRYIQSFERTPIQKLLRRMYLQLELGFRKTLLWTTYLRNPGYLRSGFSAVTILAFRTRFLKANNRRMKVERWVKKTKMEFKRTLIWILFGW